MKIQKVAASLLVAALCSGTFFGASAFADDGNASTAANGQKGLFNLTSGEVLCKGQWAFSSYYNKWDRRVQSDPFFLSFDPTWSHWDMDVERLSVGIGYGVSDRFELSVMLPYWSYDASSFMMGNGSVGYLNGRLFNEGIIDQSGIGNVRLGGKYQLSRNPKAVFALTGFVDLPTGDEDESVVTGSTGFGVGLAWSNAAGWVINAGYEVPGDSDYSDDTLYGEVSDEIRAGIGYARDITPKFQWITELSGIAYTESNGEHDAADITSGGRMRLANPDWALNFGLRVDLSDTGFDYTPIGGLVGVSYAPRNKFVVKVEKPVAKGANGKEYPGTGSVKSTDGQIDCGAVCEAKYRCGDSTTLEASADATSRFVGWTGACGGDAAQVTLTIEGEDKTCGATFIRQYDAKGEVGFKKHPDEGFVDGAGKLVMSYTGGPGNGSKECSTKDCKAIDARLDGGASVTFEAKPEAKSTFEWSGDCKGQKGNSVTLTLEKDTSCGVTFIGPPPVRANLELLVRGSGDGQILAKPASRDNVSACDGDCKLRYIGAEPVKVTLDAVPSEGSTFAGWAGACSGTGNSSSVVMDVDKTCIAIFQGPVPVKDLVACGGRGKKARVDAASCDTRVEVITFAAGSTEVPKDFWPTKKNGGKPKKGALCELADTLSQCPAVKACIVGHSDAAGDAAQAAARAEAVRRFFGSQHDFLSLGWDRYRVSTECGVPAAAGAGATVVIEKK